MGTRALTHIFDGAHEIACVYRQMDGYKSAHGADLAKFLLSAPFVNGISDSRAVFNGMGCFAAQLIGHMKRGEAGRIYLYPAASNDVGEEYVYEIRGGLDAEHRPLPVTVRCVAYGKELFNGTPEDFKVWCETEEDEE